MIGQKNNIYIVGMPGSGKTTIGKALSKFLSKIFYDADSEIEKLAGLSIPDIFKQHGETVFRNYEKEVIMKLTAQDNIIMATGGGAVLAAENRALLVNSGLVIYLAISPLTQLARIKQQPGQRPLLPDHTAKTHLEDLAKVREPLYREVADLTYQVDNLTVRQLLDCILFDLNNQLS